MGFVAEPGIVLDVLSYSMFHFNYNSINYREKLYSNQEENPFLYYDQFRSGSRKIDPPPQLYPFFFYNPRGSSLTLMFSYIWNHNDFQGRTAEAYYGGLKGEVFKRYCLNYYLSGFSADVSMAGVMAGDAASCMRALALLSGHGENLIYFVDFFMNFDRLCGELREYLYDCHKKIAAFHEKLIPKLYDRLYGEYVQHEAIIKRMANISEKIALAKEDFTIDLMEHLAILHKYDEEEKRHLFFIGASLSQSITRWSDYADVGTASVAQAFGNEVKYAIIQELRKGERTVSQLAKKLYISRSSIDRYILSLYEGLVVMISKKVGTEIYYKLNPVYFLVAKEKIKTELEEIYDDITYNSF